MTGAFGSLLAVKNKTASAPARGLFAAGIGALGFGAFRLALGSMFEGNQFWASFREEVTELELVAGMGAVLWIFRGRLLARTPQALDRPSPPIGGGAPEQSVAAGSKGALQGSI